MRGAIAKWWVPLLVMLWMPGAHGLEAVAEGQAVDQTVAEQSVVVVEGDVQREKAKGTRIFWVVLGVSLLFVLGSALALNGLSGGKPPRRDGDGSGPSS